jgi:glycosyltransferase involved in cell wall biosynthesis
MRPELSVLMPVYNERATVVEAIEQVLAAGLPVDGLELIVVDDGSTDGTRELLEGRTWPVEVRLLRHERNRGKGAAVRTALAEARGRSTTILDADLEYDPANIPPLLEPIAAREAEAVFGVRGFQSHSAYSFWYVVGNKAVTLSANLLYNSWLSDLMTCHKVVRTELFRDLRLREQGFGIEPEIAARLLQRGVRVYEVPITYQARSRAAGKKLTALDGLWVLRTLVRCRLDRRGVPAERRAQRLGHDSEPPAV